VIRSPVHKTATAVLLVYTGGDAAQPATLVSDYLGLERVTGTLDGRAGSFVVAHEGRHEGGAAHTKGRIVADPATGELAGLSGEVEAAAGDMTYQVTISNALDNPAMH
jgi:Protein of unknown function (DUF3224)